MWCRSPAKSASKEIQAMIQAGSDDAERFGQLVDVLLDSELPFKESSLGGGEWQVRNSKCARHKLLLIPFMKTVSV